MIVFYCVNPSCRKRFRADDKLAGRLARCTRCNLTLRVPKPDGSPPSPGNEPGDFDAAFTTPDRPRTPAEVSAEPDESGEGRGVHPALKWLGGVVAIATLLGGGYWWLGQPSSQQEESFKNYLRTSDDLVEMHRAVAGDSDLAQTRKKLFDKAQENLDAWKQIQEITGRKRKSLDEKYESELSAATRKRFELVKDYTTSDSMPMLVFWGRTSPQGVAFFESAASGEYKVLSLERGNTGATASKTPSTTEKKATGTPVDPPIVTPKEVEKEKPNPVALKKEIIGMWVSVANKSQSIEFLANGTGVILESNGTIKVTFYDFVTNDTIQYADSSDRVKLKLDGEQLEVTDSMGRAIKYRREKVVEPPVPLPSGGKGKTFNSKIGGFSVEVPPDGTVDEGKDQVTVKLKGGSDSFSVSWAAIDKELLKTKTVEQLLDERRDKLVAALRAPVKSELLSEKKITLNGHPGRALEIKKTGLDTGSFVITDTVTMFRGRVVIANGRMLMVYTLGKPEFTSAKETTQFLESFAVTEKAEEEPPQPKKEPVSLQGNWEINRVVTGDNVDIKSDSDKPPTVTLKHDKDAATGTCSVQGIANSPGGQAYLSFIALPANSRLKLDATSDPLAIDLTPDRGKKLEGICKFEDANTLVICLSTLARPKEFDTTKEPKGGYRVLITLKRKPA